MNALNDMNDIILQDDAKKPNLRKILTLLAMLLLIILIVLILIKFINKGNIDTTANLQIPSKEEIITPKANKPSSIVINEIKNDKKIESKKEENIAIQNEIKEEEPKKLVIKPEEAIIQTVEPIAIKEEEQKLQEQSVEQKIDVKKVKIEPKEEPKQAVKQNEIKKIEPVKTKVEPKKEEVKIKVEPAKAKTEAKKDKVVKKTETAPAKKPEPVKVEKQAQNTQNSNKATGNYIQVFALTQYDPNSKNIKAISEKGYTPIVNKNGNYTKILVGPFKNDTELNKALNDMRLLSKDAFVQRVK